MEVDLDQGRWTGRVLQSVGSQFPAHLVIEGDAGFDEQFVITSLLIPAQ